MTAQRKFLDETPLSITQACLEGIEDDTETESHCSPAAAMSWVSNLSHGLCRTRSWLKCELAQLKLATKVLKRPQTLDQRKYRSQHSLLKRRRGSGCTIKSTAEPLTLSTSGELDCSCQLFSRPWLTFVWQTVSRQPTASSPEE